MPDSKKKGGVVIFHIPLKTLNIPKIARLFENGNLKVEIC
jgi:hypothetical protein